LFPASRHLIALLFSGQIFEQWALKNIAFMVTTQFNEDVLVPVIMNIVGKACQRFRINACAVPANQ
jgi:hypothetical protein